MLKKIGSPTIARIYAQKYADNVLQHFKQDTWKLEGLEVARWINNNTQYKINIEAEEKLENFKQEERLRAQKEDQAQRAKKNKTRRRDSKKTSKEKKKKEKKY